MYLIRLRDTVEEGYIFNHRINDFHTNHFVGTSRIVAIASDRTVRIRIKVNKPRSGNSTDFTVKPGGK